MYTSINILESLQKRNINFGFLKKALRSHSLPSARGWSDLLDKYASYTATIDKEHSKKLMEIFDTHVLAGPCACGIIDLKELDNKVLDKLYTAFQAIPIDKSDYLAKYPLPLDNPELEKASGNALVDKIDGAAGCCDLIYSMKKTFKERIELSADDFDTSHNDFIESFSKIIGYHEGYFQPFDIVTFNFEKKKIFVSIDLAHDQIRDGIEGALSAYHRKLSELFSAHLGKTAFPYYENLFPSIAFFYNSSHGVIEELFHFTPSGSVKKEVMRDNNDLRTEIFHESGVEAIAENRQKIYPYSIKVKWKEHEDFSDPELIISATLLSASSTPTVHFVKIYNCANVDAKDRILSLLS